MAKLLTQAQFARKLKYSRARICQLVKSGIIQLKNGRIDPRQANAAIEANIDRTRRVRSESAKNGKKKRVQSEENPQTQLLPGILNTDPKKEARHNGFNTHPQLGVFSFTETKRQHEAVKMELSKLKLEIEKGNLVPRDEVGELLSLIVNKAKIKLLGLPKRMAGSLAAISDEREIEYKLRQEIRKILEELGTPLSYAEKKTGKINATPASAS